VVTYAVEQMQRLMHTILVRGNTIGKIRLDVWHVCLFTVASFGNANVKGKQERAYHLLML
jgi:hypothetical protein